MRPLDPVILIGTLDPPDPLFARQSLDHLHRVEQEPDVFVPEVSILEAFLVMKVRRYNYEERRSRWQALDYRIPLDKLLANQISTIHAALLFLERGMDYDSLIACPALDDGAMVVTTDRAIKGIVASEW